MTVLKTVALFLLAAAGELGGTYLIWQWMRNGRPAWFALAGAVALFLYGLVQTAQVFSFGRAFAAYGGVFVASAVLWGWLIDGRAPDRIDIAGAVVCLIGVGIILAGPRQ